MTDNRNRTVAEIRHIFSKNGGNMGEAGSVAWMFERRATSSSIRPQKAKTSFSRSRSKPAPTICRTRATFSRSTPRPTHFEAVSEAIKTAGIEPQAAEVSMIPQNYIELEGGDAKTMLKLYDAIDDNDDVQKVYANFDIDESEMG